MKMSEMLSDTGEDMGGGGGAVAQPAAQAPAPTTAPAGSPAAPTGTSKAVDPSLGNDAFFGGGSDAMSAPPTPNFGPSTPTPTAPMAPGIPADPFGGAGGIAGQTGDPLAFAPYTPPSTVGAPPAAPVELGGAQMAPDTSGFPGGDPNASTPTAFTGTPAVERYGQDYGAPTGTAPMDVGPPQMQTDEAPFTSTPAPISVNNPSPVTPAMPQGGFNAPINFGLPENQTTPLGAGEAQPYVSPDQRGPAVPTYQPPAYIPPDTMQSPVTPPPIERPTDTGMPSNSPTNIAPTLPPVSVSNPTPPPTPFVPPVSAPTVLPNVPEATTTPAAAGPQGTPTPAASVPATTLPPQTQTQLTTMTGGTNGPEQGTLPPVSVNGLNAAPASSMLTENTGMLGGGGGTAPSNTPPIAAPVTPPLMAPTATPAAATPTAAPTAPIAVSSTGLGGNAVPAFNPATVPTTGSAYAPQTSAVTPENALTGQQISVAPTADRFALAQQKLSDFVNQSNPAYQAALREATQRSAAAGGLGSGMLRTSYGNAELARENQLNTTRNQFLTDALQGTIGDAYQNAQIAAQQQGFQNQQQQQAFANAMAQQELANQMQQQGFNQAQQQLNSGSSGSPADMGVLLSQIFGQQATGSANAAGQIAQGVQGQQNAQTQQQMLLAYLNSMGINPQGAGVMGNAGSSGGNGLPGTSGTGDTSGLNDWLSQFGAPLGTQPTGPQQTTVNPDTGQMEYADPFATEDPFQAYQSFGQMGYK